MNQELSYFQGSENNFSVPFCRTIAVVKLKRVALEGSCHTTQPTSRSLTGQSIQRLNRILKAIAKT